MQQNPRPLASAAGYRVAPVAAGHARLPQPACQIYRSPQFGRTSAPTMPQRVHTIRGPNVGTGTSSGHG
jgi:hypothetical protein